MKLYVEVLANGHNESGCVFVIHKGWWIFLASEVGRVFSVKQLDDFLAAYKAFNGKELK